MSDRDLLQFVTVMFTAARLKLTFWYLLIIMVISVLFSSVIYNGVSRELDRFEHMMSVRREDDFFGTRIRRVPTFDPGEINKVRQKFLLSLGLINLGILAVSAISGYFLAGKTLRPIKQMVEDQNRFVADASHELRTPLTALKTSIEVALRDKKMTLSQARQLLSENLVETDHLQYLSDNLLRLTQLESLPKNKTFAHFDISEAITQSIKKVRPKAQEKKIKIDVNVQNAQVVADKNSIIELLVILLDNAIKYSPPGKIVSITTHKTTKHLQISVRDEGLGIEEDDLPNIFDRFFRADQSRSKEKVEGYGLGLSIAQKIVDLHHAKIEVKSKVGEGTTFTVTI